MWEEHFKLDGPVIRPLTLVAEATIRVLRMNEPERMEERRILQKLNRYGGPG